MDAYKKICQICDDITEKACDIANDDLVIKSAQEIIDCIKERKDKIFGDFNNLFSRIQTSYFTGEPLVNLSKEQIEIIYSLMAKEIGLFHKQRQG